MATPLGSSSSSLTPSPSRTFKAGDSLTIQGPSIYRDLTPPATYPLPAPDSAHPPRHLHRDLVGPRGMAESSAIWEVELIEVRPLMPKGRYECTTALVARQGSKEKRKVDLHIYHSSIPSLSFDYESQVAYNSGSLVRLTPEIECSYYHTYRALQGREMCICYGIFSTTFEGDHVWVLVLENYIQKLGGVRAWAQAYQDLERPILVTLHSAFEDYELTPETAFALYSSQSQTLRRFLTCDKTLFPNIIARGVLGSSDEDSVHIVAAAFHNPSSMQEVKEQITNIYIEDTSSRDDSPLKPDDVELHLPALITRHFASTRVEDVVARHEDLYEDSERIEGLEWDESLPL